MTEHNFIGDKFFFKDALKRNNRSFALQKRKKTAEKGKCSVILLLFVPPVCLQLLIYTRQCKNIHQQTNILWLHYLGKLFPGTGLCLLILPAASWIDGCKSVLGKKKNKKQNKMGKIEDSIWAFLVWNRHGMNMCSMHLVMHILLEIEIAFFFYKLLYILFHL